MLKVETDRYGVYVTDGNRGYAFASTDDILDYEIDEVFPYDFETKEVIIAYNRRRKFGYSNDFERITVRVLQLNS